MPISETETLLRERIDDLSTRLLIEGADQEESGDGATAFVEALGHSPGGERCRVWRSGARGE